MPFGELAHLLAPIGAVAGPSVHEHQRRPRAVHLVRDVSTSHRARAVRGMQRARHAERKDEQAVADQKTSAGETEHIRHQNPCAYLHVSPLLPETNSAYRGIPGLSTASSA